jgi:hypothetical protein
MRLRPGELYVANLRGELSEGSLGYMPPAAALEALRRMSGLDFGMDAERWGRWLKSRPKPPPVSWEQGKRLVQDLRRRHRAIRRIAAALVASPGRYTLTCHRCHAAGQVPADGRSADELAKLFFERGWRFIVGPLCETCAATGEGGGG